MPKRQAEVTCPLCGELITEHRPRHWLREDGWLAGPYCSMPCADNDRWGPAFRKAKLVRRVVREEPS